MVGGFLGAGKTTLLRQLLSAPKLPEKIALMINEIGDAVVDAHVLRRSGSGVVELANGCICCSVTGDFVQGLIDIKKNFSPDRVLIEPTGIAEPGRILSALYRPPLESEFRVEPTVIVIDAGAFSRFFKVLAYLYVMQIKSADLILLNKTDLAAKSEADRTEREVRKLNPRALILRTERCRVDLLNLLEGAPVTGPDARVSRSVNHKLPVFESFAFRSEKIFSRKKMEQFLDRQTANVFRVKGFVRLADGFHLLNYTAGLTEWEPFEPSEPATLLTVIGANLNREKWISQISKSATSGKGEPHAKSHRKNEYAVSR